MGTAHRFSSELAVQSREHPPGSLLVLRDHQTGLFQHLGGEGVGVAVFEDEVLHACVDDHLGADAAGLVCAIERCAFDVRPVLGRLDYGVLLGMEPAADLVPLAGGDAELLTQAPAVQAVCNAGRRTIVARGKDVFVLHEHCAHLAAETGGALLHQVRNFHEIFVPGGARVLRH